MPRDSSQTAAGAAPRNELMFPSEPIRGRSLMNLKMMLESYLGGDGVGGEVRDLDLAMLMNVPLNRLSQLKRARSSIETVGRDVDTEAGDDESDDDDARSAAVGELEAVPPDAADLPGLRPNQAILVRLLLQHPEWVPMPLRPSPAALFELLQPFMPAPAGKGGFAPLFGRSSVSSYKMLADTDAGTQAAGVPVVRLQLLVVGQYARVFAAALREEAAADTSAPDSVMQTLAARSGWGLLRERDSLTDWMGDDQLLRFEARVAEGFRHWFEDQYLAVLADEARSRDLSLDEALVKGKWANSAPVSDADFATYSRPQKPILGRADSLFSLFRESFGLTSAEAYWVLGLQVKAFYRFRQRPDRRVDAPTAILLRYLFRYPGDIDLFIPPPMAGADILEAIRRERPDLRTSQLGPLFGASRVMSYDFASEGTPCPFFARRLSMVFSACTRAGEPIVEALWDCVEDEVRARGLSLEQFWRDGRWHQ
ncbi:hypothetical protein [Marinobacter sp. C2H3]|uniref:hypothetical protein n=1 Tax=Marinobacter sp. C2H3 TaxID=3119003 RepID=UPI00300F703A